MSPDLKQQRLTSTFSCWTHSMKRPDVRCVVEPISLFRASCLFVCILLLLSVPTTCLKAQKHAATSNLPPLPPLATLLAPDQTESRPTMIDTGSLLPLLLPIQGRAGSP